MKPGDEPGKLARPGPSPKARDPGDAAGVSFFDPEPPRGVRL